ncbi:protease Do-like 7 isoform X1 [Panicum miliaceum]|uniref:Protease Do-like 7 isoform X1 n=1 Tax=Panicum miliaceum TaxID=4540 RepID=A0A3L6RXE8_PANMI|nr:protease Do-like 7 isoform X1 [Panicum miliaceum]
MESPAKEDAGGELAMEIESSVTADDWRRALSRVVPSVVVLRTTAPRAFDTEVAGASYATGFVVDKSRGIILTNRHVVKPGPVVAEAMFVNREEIPVYPMYRDPVHDFGFFRYDPGAIKFLKYDEIPLAPEAASVGLEIRVVGNDSGEKVSILAGTLARLDREAPYYKKYAFFLSLHGYLLFIPIYFYHGIPLHTAASGTKGGSSGSPVVDCQGRAVALNAGSKSSSASAFFLPLERVVRALNLIRDSWDGFGTKPESIYIPRGTLQATFQHKGFEETRRLGLRNETEQMVRVVSPDGETGMLVVDSVVPEGPAHKHLEPGDVLVRINEGVVTQFLRLETLLDDSVGMEIDLQIERGGVPLTVKLQVEDLHSITPNHFLEVSGAVIHPLSYQQARNFRFKCGLVYVAEAGYMLSRASVPRHAIIKKLAGEDIANLDDLIAVLSKLARGSRVPLEYVRYTDRHRNKSVLVTIDQHEWYAPPQLYTRNDATGLWTAKPAIPPESPFLASAHHTNHVDTNLNSVPSLSESSPMDLKCQYDSETLADGCIKMQNDDEIVVDGSHSSEDSLVEKKRRRVDEEIAAEGTLPSYGDLEDVKDGLLRQPSNGEGSDLARTISSNASLAEQVIEPALVMFEASTYTIEAERMLSLGKASFIYLTFHEPALRRGDSVYLVGLSRSLQATSRKSIITNPCTAVNIGSADCPRYRAINMEVIELDTDFGSSFSGILTDEQGRVQALWASFSTQEHVLKRIKKRTKRRLTRKLKYGCSSSEDHQFVRGIPIYAISQVLEKIISGTQGPFRLINGMKRPMPFVRLLEVELYPTLLSKARSYGLSDNWVQALAKKDPVRRQVLRVKGCLAGSKAENLLEQGDMILAINKEPITCFLDIEKACQELDQSIGSDGVLNMTIFRQGKEIDLIVGTDVRDGNGTTRMVNWCGCIIQDPHSAVRALGFLPEEGHGVYVARWCHGSPVHRYGLYALQWIIEINGQPTPDLETFIQVVKGLEDGEFVRVRTVHLNGKPRVLTLKQDLHYWPTWELSFEPETATWRRRTIKALQSTTA